MNSPSVPSCGLPCSQWQPSDQEQCVEVRPAASSSCQFSAFLLLALQVMKSLWSDTKWLFSRCSSAFAMPAGNAFVWSKRGIQRTEVQ